MPGKQQSDEEMGYFEDAWEDELESEDEIIVEDEEEMQISEDPTSGSDWAIYFRDILKLFALLLISFHFSRSISTILFWLKYRPFISLWYSFLLKKCFI